MRAAVFAYDDSDPTVELRTIDDPAPGPGEAVVRVEACSLNHSDLWVLDGGDYDEPYIPGADVAGVVDAVGEGVTSVSPGDRVVLCPNLTCGTCRYCREGPENQCAEYAIYHGGFAESCAVRADRLLVLPNGVPLADAAALPIAYMTAWHMLRRGEAGPGDTVVVPGATGGVGVAGVQLANAIGARTVGSTRSDRKADRLEELGVDRVVVSDDPDELRRAVDGEAADVVLNHLGGPFTHVGMVALARGGRMVVCGRTAGAESTIPIRDLYWRHKRVIGSTMGTQPDLETLVGLVSDGSLAPVIDETFALEETAAAFESMRDRSVFGKLLVEPGS